MGGPYSILLFLTYSQQLLRDSQKNCRDKWQLAKNKSTKIVYLYLMGGIFSMYFQKNINAGGQTTFYWILIP